MKSLYKAIKYSKKTNNKNYLSIIDTHNSEFIYKISKSNYLQKNIQTGGANLIKPENISQIKLTHCAFHGSLETETMMKVPENIYLIMPLCCGFGITSTLDEEKFFFKSEEEIISYVNENSSNGVLQVENQHFIILKPGDEYCDINLSFTFDLDKEIGIFSHQTKKNKNNSIEQIITTSLRDEYIDAKISQNDLDFYDKVAIDKLTKANMNNVKNETHETHETHETYDVEFDSQITTNSGIFNIFKKNVFEIGTHKFLVPIDQQLDKIENNSNTLSMKETFINVDYGLILMGVISNDLNKNYLKICIEKLKNGIKNLKQFNSEIIQNQINDILGFVEEINVNIYSNIIKKSESEKLPIFIQKLCDTIFNLKFNFQQKDENNESMEYNLKIFEDLEKEISSIDYSKIILDLMDEINIIELLPKIKLEMFKKTYKIPEHNILKKMTIINNYLLSTDIYYFDKDVMVSPKFRYLIDEIKNKFFGILKISAMEENEKIFLKIVYTNNPPGYVGFTLNDVLTFLTIVSEETNKNQINFVFNKSCQSIKPDENVCKISKCFSQVMNKLGYQKNKIEYSDIFNQKDINKLIDVLVEIDKIHKIVNINHLYETNISLYFSLQCILHAIGISRPDIIAMVFIMHSEKEYPFLLSHLKYDLNNNVQDLNIWKDPNINTIIAVINLYISNFYNKIDNKSENDLGKFIFENMSN